MIVLDAPMGTRLIDEHGLKPDDVLFANLTHPELVRSLHARDVAAGAEIVLTNTFALPYRANELKDAEIATLVDAAIAHALSAAPKAVHISLGPAMLTNEADRQRVLTCAVAAAKRTRASGLWFESLSPSDLGWLVNVMSSLRQTEIAATFLAGDEGDAGFVRDLDRCWALGFNCSRAYPNTDAATLASADTWQRAPLSPQQKRIAKPARVSQPTLRALAVRFDLVGVCCGGTSDDLAALRAA